MTKVNRKKFLKITGISLIAIGSGAIIKIFKDDIFKIKRSPSKKLKGQIKKGTLSVNKQKTPVSVSAVEKDLKDAVKKAALSATDFKWLKKGQTVFIKPVVNSGYPYPSTTSPDAIRAMIELLREKGAGRIIVGDMSGIEHLRFFQDSTKGSTKELMQSSGILKAVLDAKAEPHFFEEGGWDRFFTDHADTKGFFTNGFMMPKILNEVDHIVLMPRCSRHVLAGASLGLKAVVGYWRTDTRLEYHENGHQLHERTAEGNRARTLLDKQRLVISTGDKILSTFGPDKGHVFTPKQGIVIASESVVAHDMVSLSWLLHNRNLLPEDKQDLFVDTSKGVAKTANTFVVKMLSRSWFKGLLSKPLFKNNLSQIWDDRTLNHAYLLWKGIPNIKLKNADKGVKDETLKTLQAMTSLTKT